VPHTAIIDLFRPDPWRGSGEWVEAFDRGHLLGRDKDLVTSRLPGDDIASSDWLP